METYNKYVIVDAENAREAEEKAEKVYEQDDNYLFDAVLDCCDNQEVNFFVHGEASEDDEKYLNPLEKYEQ